MRIVGPYIKNTNIYDGYIRPRLFDNGFHGIWKDDKGVWKAATIHNKTFTSKIAAMAALDELLIKEGWTIVDHEKFEAMKVLM